MRLPVDEHVSGGPLQSFADPAIEEECDVTIQSDVWEYGSDFHWPHMEPAGVRRPPPWSGAAGFVGSGRDGFRLVLDEGVTNRGWRRLLIPSYMCPTVMESLVSSGITVRAYPDRPAGGSESPVQVNAGTDDVVLDLNLFGLRDRSNLIVPDGVDVIEDHTHDPWSEWARRSDAAYAVASFRKVLPVPTGGVIWSPQGLTIPDPPAPTPDRLAASAKRMQAMILKGLYLDGHDVDKSLFRSLAQSGESKVATPPISGIPPADRALLDLFPAEAWRDTRLENHRYLMALFGGAPGVTILESVGTGSVPLSLVLVFHDARTRESVRERLLERDIYPTVLWDLTGAPAVGLTEEDLKLSRRIMSVPVDWRYGPDDLRRVAEVLSVAVRDSIESQSVLDTAILRQSADGVIP